MKRILIIALALLVVSSLAIAIGSKKKRKKPHQYGSVLIDNYSTQAGLKPVEFDHWTHRSQFTCRLCHVDLGFAMKTGDTEIRAIDNQRGFYCGACHDGNHTFANKKLFTSCVTELPELKNKKTTIGTKTQHCDNCHKIGSDREKEERFYSFQSGLPRERFGNGIDWEAAEKEGKVKLIDFLEGISVKQTGLVVQNDFDLDAKLLGMPEIIFSHQKHTVWNGCEVCHPDIFLGIRKGATQYTMIDLFQNKFCGVCHGTVAFSLMDCQRCHTKQVN